MGKLMYSKFNLFNLFNLFTFSWCISRMLLYSVFRVASTVCCHSVWLQYFQE